MRPARLFFLIAISLLSAPAPARAGEYGHVQSFTLGGIAPFTLGAGDPITAFSGIGISASVGHHWLGSRWGVVGSFHYQGGGMLGSLALRKYMLGQAQMGFASPRIEEGEDGKITTNRDGEHITIAPRYYGLYVEFGPSLYNTSEVLIEGEDPFRVIGLSWTMSVGFEYPVLKEAFAYARMNVTQAMTLNFTGILTEIGVGIPFSLLDLRR